MWLEWNNMRDVSERLNMNFVLNFRPNQFRMDNGDEAWTIVFTTVAGTYHYFGRYWTLEAAEKICTRLSSTIAHPTKALYNLYDIETGVFGYGSWEHQRSVVDWELTNEHAARLDKEMKRVAKKAARRGDKAPELETCVPWEGEQVNG